MPSAGGPTQPLPPSVSRKHEVKLSCLTWAALYNSPLQTPFLCKNGVQYQMDSRHKDWGCVWGEMRWDEMNHYGVSKLLSYRFCPGPKRSGSNLSGSSIYSGLRSRQYATAWMHNKIFPITRNDGNISYCSFKKFKNVSSNHQAIQLECLHAGSRTYHSMETAAEACGM